VEVGEDVLDGWEIIEEGYFDGLEDLVGEAEWCEGGMRNYGADCEG